MRASSTCCEITSTSCAKGCASTRKSRLSDRARDPTRGAAETAAALRDFNLAYVAVGSVPSHPDLRDAPGMSAMPPIATQSVRRNEALLCAANRLTQRSKKSAQELASRRSRLVGLTRT